MSSKLLSVFLTLALTAPVLSTSVAQLVGDLRLAPTAVDRIKLLPDDNDFVFNFLDPPGGTGEVMGAGGHTVAASSANFPALIGTGMAMTIGFLGPCGLNTPHTHPRATEFNFAVNGTLQAGLLTENGARFIFHEIQPGSAAIFPQGAIHFEMNTECEPAMFVAAFNNEDPGVDQIAQRFFGLPPSFVAAALGGGDIGVQQVAGLESKIPDNVALGTDECLKRCGITRGDQPTKQREPRNSANALPSGFSGPPEPAPAASATPAAYVSSPSTSQPYSPSSSPSGTAAVASGHDVQNLSGGVSLTDSEGKVNPLLIGLIAAIGVLVLGYIAILLGWCIKRRNEKKSRGVMGVKYSQTGAEFAPHGAMFESEKASMTHTDPYDPHN